MVRLRRLTTLLRVLLALAVVVAFQWASQPTSHADTRPSTTKLIASGVGFGVPTYMLGVAIHEGSHALAGKLVGATIVDFSLIPGFHPRNKRFYFGYVSVRGIRSNKQRAWFLLAPKISDTILLTGFAGLHATGSLPDNHYAETALLVLATGFWVDFSKDILAFGDHNDTVKIYNILGLDTELARLPARLVHVGLSVAMGYAIYRGYEELFAHPTTGTGAPGAQFLLPLLDGSF